MCLDFRIVFLLNIETKSLHVTSRFPLLKWRQCKIGPGTWKAIATKPFSEWKWHCYWWFYCSYFWFKDLNKPLSISMKLPIKLLSVFLSGLSGMWYFTTPTSIAQMTGPRCIKSGPDFKGVDVMSNMCLCHAESSGISSHPTAAAISHPLLEEGHCYFS